MRHWLGSAFALLLICAAAQNPATASGDPEIDPLIQSQECGLLTDWRVTGPFGKHPLADFSRAWMPEKEKPRNLTRHDRDLRFASGLFTIPASLRATGVYYATSQVYLYSDGNWNLWIESPGTIQLFVDGESELLRDDRRQSTAETLRKTVHLAKGNHLLMVKFVPSASPFRVAVMAPGGGVRQHRNIPLQDSVLESQFVSVLFRPRPRDLSEMTTLGRAYRAWHGTVWRQRRVPARNQISFHWRVSANGLAKDCPLALECWHSRFELVLPLSDVPSASTLCVNRLAKRDVACALHRKRVSAT